jgi:hypothetical protein
MIGCQTIIHNWQETLEPPGFALFINEDPEGYHIVNTKGTNIPNFSDSDGSNLEISTLPLKSRRFLERSLESRESYSTQRAKNPIQL